MTSLQCRIWEVQKSDFSTILNITIQQLILKTFRDLIQPELQQHLVQHLNML